MKNKEGIKNNSGQLISEKALRKRKKREAIQKASKSFVPGTYDKLVWIKGKK